jgi:hypothetical protein
MREPAKEVRVKGGAENHFTGLDGLMREMYFWFEYKTGKTRHSQTKRKTLKRKNSTRRLIDLAKHAGQARADPILFLRALRFRETAANTQRFVREQIADNQRPSEN